MYIFLLTNSKVEVDFDKDVVDFPNQRPVYLGINNTHESSLEGHTFLLSGIRFTRNFIEKMQVTLRATPYFFNVISTDYFPVWELEPQEALRIQRHIRLLADHTKRVRLHPFGKEI